MQRFVCVCYCNDFQIEDWGWGGVEEHMGQEKPIKGEVILEAQFEGKEAQIVCLFVGWYSRIGREMKMERNPNWEERVWLVKNNVWHPPHSPLCNAIWESLNNL